MEKGLNKWGWDMNSEDLHCLDDYLLQAGYDGPSVAPGQYRARITVGEARGSTAFAVAKDPRSFASDVQIDEWAATLHEVKSMMNDMLYTLEDARQARAQIKALMAAHDDAELHEWGAAAVSGITAWEAKINQRKHETYEDEDAWETMIDGQLRYLMDVIDSSGAPVTDGAKTRLEDLRGQWIKLQSDLRGITDSYIVPINRWASSQQISHVVSPLD